MYEESKNVVLKFNLDSIFLHKIVENVFPTPDTNDEGHYRFMDISDFLFKVQHTCFTDWKTTLKPLEKRIHVLHRK